MKNKLKAKKGIIATILLMMVIAFTIGNRSHDPLTDLKNHIALGIAAATGKVEVYKPGQVDQIVLNQAQIAATEAAQAATSSAKMKQLYQQSVHYNPATGTVESSFLH